MGNERKTYQKYIVAIFKSILVRRVLESEGGNDAESWDDRQVDNLNRASELRGALQVDRSFGCDDFCCSCVKLMCRPSFRCASAWDLHERSLLAQQREVQRPIHLARTSLIKEISRLHKPGDDVCRQTRSLTKNSNILTSGAQARLLHVPSSCVSSMRLGTGLASQRRTLREDCLACSCSS